MAAGDVHVFAQAVENWAKLTGGTFNSHTIKMGIVTNATVPAVTTADPRWGSDGTTNFATNEVTPGGSYSAGGIALTSAAVALSGADTNLTATSPISLAANASNPTGAYWGIFYDSTSAGLECLGYIDLGGPLSLVAGLNININGASSGTQTLLQGVAS